MMKRLALAALGVVAVAQPGLSQNVIPTDADSECVVSAEEFEGWKVAPGSLIITPPNSFDDAFKTECDFYKWGAQMFLWLTSPTGDGRFVFDDTGFFDVVHDGAGTEKIASVKAIKNGPDMPNIFTLRAIKADDRGGSGQAGGNGVLISQNGALTYYGMHVNDAYVAFLNGTLSAPKSVNFTDDTNVQDKLFPISPENMETVLAIGEDTGIITGDQIEIAFLAGTLELKTSWVDASTVENPDSFIKVTAQVPLFLETNDTLWLADQVQDIELAMVGMHIAGPVLGHPELVWASFEHLNNSPMAPYAYHNGTTQPGADETKATPVPVVVPFDKNPEKSWTFAEPGADMETLFLPNASIGPDGNIVAAEGKTISPINVALFNPWGNAPVLDDNKDAGLTADVIRNNTTLIALNASLLEVLQGDPAARDNYYQIGSIWAEDKTLPVYPHTDGQAGGLRLANSTMETFHQFGAQDSEGGFVPQNCFACHGVSGTAGPPEYNAGTSVSHIFQGMFSYPHKD